MEKQSTGGTAFERATGSGRQYHLRGKGGFLGQSTRQGHYGFFGGGSGSKPQPGWFEPFTPQPQPSPSPKPFRFGGQLPGKTATFGQRTMNMFSPSKMAAKAGRQAALKQLAKQAFHGLAVMEGYGIAWDIAMLAYGQMAGQFAVSPGYGEPEPYDKGYACSYICPSHPPYDQGVATWGINTVGGSCAYIAGLVCTPLQVPTTYPGHENNIWPVKNPAEPRLLTIGPYTPVSGVPRYFVHKAYWYPGHAGLNGKPVYVLPPLPQPYIPAADPFPEPQYNPYTPMENPILRVTGFPPAAPYKYANGPTPDANSARGYGGNGPPSGRPPVGTRAANRRNPPLPNLWPHGPPVHEVRPPRPNEKERKKRIPQGQFTKLVKGAYGAYTESKDATNSVYKALPKSTQKADWLKNGRKPLSQYQKLKSLYDHAHEINMAAALKNLAMDNLQDMIIGKANKAANKITKNPYWHRPVGPAAGGRYHPTNLAQYYLQ